MSEIKKPVITKEQAEALILLQGDLTDSAILELYVGDSLAARNPRNRCLYDLDLLTLAAALINGYEVDKTPEEKIREYFKELSKDIQHYLEFGERKLAETKMEERATALKILDLLGMKVVGVDV